MLGIVFVPVFLSLVLIQNFEVYFRGPLPGGRAAEAVLSALGAKQRWPMFGAYFPNRVRVPVVRVFVSGRGFEFLLPVVGPEISEALLGRLDPQSDAEAKGVATWVPAIGESRMEKYESRVANSQPGWIGVRTAYVAHRLRDFLAETSLEPSAVRLVDLWGVEIKSARDGTPLEVLRVHQLELLPTLVPDWPAPMARLGNPERR